MYSLGTVQTKVSTVLQDECVCRRAGVGGMSGGGGGHEPCRRGNVGGGRWSQWS